MNVTRKYVTCRRTMAGTIALAVALASVASRAAVPVDPATLNPYVLLDANAGVGGGGLNQTVTGWTDQSANGFAFQANHPNAGSNNPQLVLGPNANLAIALDGSDIIDSDDNLQLFTADDSALTIFTVMNPASLSGNQQSFINHSPGVGGDSFEMGPDGGQVQSPGAWGIHRGSSQAASTVPNTLTAGAFQIMTTEINSVGLSGTNVAFFKDGAYQANASTGWLAPGSYATGSDPLAIGARIDNKGQGFDTLSPNSFFSGEVAQIVIFRDKLSASDRQGVEAFLGNKYGIAVSESVAPDPILPEPLQPGETIGSDLIDRSCCDGDVGGVYIYGDGSFSVPGVAVEYGFVGTEAGRTLTPLIVEIVSGSIDGNDAVYSITGIGQSITSVGGSSPQVNPFVLVAGSDAVSSTSTFGHFDGTIESDGQGGVNILSRNAGTVVADFGAGSAGQWAFSGGGQVPFDVELGETFALVVTPGGSGDANDPIRVFTRASGSGRNYSAQMRAVPEPATLMLAVLGCLAMAAGGPRRRKR